MIYLAITPLIALIIIAQVFWTDWIVKEIYNKDINNWMIFLSLVIIALFTPKALSGLTCLMMVMATVYIWFIM